MAINKSFVSDIFIVHRSNKSTVARGQPRFSFISGVIPHLKWLFFPSAALVLAVVALPYLSLDPVFGVGWVLFFLFAAWFMARYFFTNARDSVRLWTTGRLVDGTVQRAEGQFIKRPRQYIGRGDWWLTIHYSFVNPEGNVLNGVELVKRNDLADYADLSGSKLKVMYVNNILFSAL